MTTEDRRREAEAHGPRAAARSGPAIAGSDLAPAIRAGDPDALREVIETYLPQVLRAAHGAGLATEDAEEVTQETFTTFLEIAPRFEGRSHVRTFLFGILRNKIAASKRWMARARTHDPIDEVMESRFRDDGRWFRPPAATDRLVRHDEIRRAISDCLRTSPTAQRMAFYLREVEGLARQEICSTLEITSTNLDVMLYRLRNRTRECLEAREVESSS